MGENEEEEEELRFMSHYLAEIELTAGIHFITAIEPSEMRGAVLKGGKWRNLMEKKQQQQKK